MAGRYHLCSGPEEILFYIVEHLGSPGPSRVWPDGQPIRFANDQVLHLSHVNHLFRRLCLPLLYQHIAIMLTNGSMHSSPFDLFRRAMERKPHLADLVRVIEVEGYSTARDTNHHVFDSLPFLPKIKQIDSRPNIKLDLDSLSVINSHPSLTTVHWHTNTNAFSFPNPLSLPHGALSRVRINQEALSEDSNSIELLWLCFTKLGLRVKILNFTGTTPPPFLSLTYPDLCQIKIYVTSFFNSDSPEPFGWFPSFLKRHPQLEVFWVGLGHCEGRNAWEALKNDPLIRPLYDASHSRGLISSFSFEKIFIGQINSAAIGIDSPQDFPEIIHLLGSLLPMSKISLRFRKPELHFLPMNVNDFVSVFQENHKGLSSLTLYAMHQVLDLDSLSTDEELHINDTVTNNDVLSNARLRDRAKQLAQLTRLLNAGLPQLRDFRFIDDLDYEWEFEVSGNGQVQLVQFMYD